MQRACMYVFMHMATAHLIHGILFVCRSVCLRVCCVSVVVGILLFYGHLPELNFMSMTHVYDIKSEV